MSEQEFRQAAKDFLDVVDAVERRALGSAGKQAPQPAQRPAERKASGTYQDPYTVNNDTDYNNVPKGKYYKAPDGSIRQRK